MSNLKEAENRINNLQKLEKFKTYIINNPKYTGIYRWWLRTKEK